VARLLAKGLDQTLKKIGEEATEVVIAATSRSPRSSAAAWCGQRLMHGKTSQIHHDGRGVFAACPSRSQPPATTRWWWRRTACGTASWSLPGPTTVW